MTANETPARKGKNATDSTDDDLTELERRILEFFDEDGLNHLTVEIAAINLEDSGWNVTGDEVALAFENLQHRGEIQTEPVVYERTRDD